MSWKDSFYEEVKKYLASKHDLHHVERITSVKEEETSGPMCGEGTCWDSWKVVEIDYVDSYGYNQYVEVRMDLVEFMEQL
ncbi:hypothetical protein SEA_WEASELS2_130 [Rhodococcus phage Weasels2]|uniref:Uncharacterized protein n=1 Tax=Rhodococcus phage Weasels2 TaxID=1897437 RepID=A0A1I9SAB0_9CAUD|nr:hypothetical protein FDH04_gp279 [Rhodococcus phage Weasels2]AOZ63716.1 hypothetical protein SEA_WEASELS2_130 [Rhodococcus phage Weasels2]